MAPSTPAARAAIRQGLHHVYHGDLEDRRSRYAVVEGAWPAGLTGRAFFTVFPYEAVFDRRTLEANPHMLTAPGRVLTVDLDPDDEGEIALETRYLHVQSWHVRHLAPHATVRTDFAEYSWLGMMNLSNTTPVPVFPVARAEGGPAGRRLIVSYDAGTPNEFSPGSLEHVTPVGRAESYLAAVGSSFSPMIMTTGHPVYDPAFEPGAPRLLYTHLVPRVVDFLHADRRIRADLHLMTWDGEHAPTPPIRVHVDGEPVLLEQASAHQVCLTRDHVVVFNANLVLNTAALVEPLLELIRRALHKRASKGLRARLDRAWTRVLESLHAPVPTSRCAVYVVSKKDLREALRRKATTIEARRFVLEGELTHAVARADDTDGQITFYAQHNLGADPADQLQQGDRLVDGGRADRAFLGLFTGTTDLNQVRKHTIDLRRGTVETRAFPDPDAPDEFGFGMNLLPPAQPLSYETPDAPGLPGALARCLERPELTWWVAGGYLPEVTAERAFEVFRNAGHPRLVPEETFRARMGDGSHTVKLFALDADLRLDSAYAFAPGWFAGAPVFVPRADATSVRQGWLVTCVWGPDAPHVEVWVFDTSRPLSLGPVCKLGPGAGSRGLRPGFPLHAAWIDREGVQGWAKPHYQASMLDVPTYVKVAEVGVMGAGFLWRALTQQLGR